MGVWHVLQGGERPPAAAKSTPRREGKPERQGQSSSGPPSRPVVIHGQALQRPWFVRTCIASGGRLINRKRALRDRAGENKLFFFFFLLAPPPSPPPPCSFSCPPSLALCSSSVVRGGARGGAWRSEEGEGRTRRGSGGAARTAPHPHRRDWEDAGKAGLGRGEA